MKRILLISILCLSCLYGRSNDPGVDLANFAYEQRMAKEAQEKLKKEEQKDDIMYGAIVFLVVAGGICLLSKAFKE